MWKQRVVQGCTALVYIQPLHKDLLFSPLLADGKVLGSNITLRFTVPGRAQMKLKQHPHGSRLLIFFNKEANYIPLIKVYTWAPEIVIKGYIHIQSPLTTHSFRLLSKSLITSCENWQLKCYFMVHSNGRFQSRWRHLWKKNLEI